MQITVAKSAGFCFGVRRAVRLALKTLDAKKTIYALSDLVHNKMVVQTLYRAGLRKLRSLARKDNATLLLSAHGTAQDIINKARQRGYKVVDATCPMVKHIHNIAKELESTGYPIIIIGDAHHDEVRGIVGQLKNKPLILEPQKKIPYATIKKSKRWGCLVQSTQDTEKVLRTVRKLKKKIKNLKFYNTICAPTRFKQEEIKKLALKNELILIIGSKTSANTQRLYEISKKLNPRSYWIQIEKDLRQNWFKGIKKVGISAGASTPEETILAVRKKIQALEAE